MDEDHVCDVLNDVLEAEAASLLPRLTECTAFVPPAELSRFEAVKRMASEHSGQLARLARTLIDAGGQPFPHAKDMRTAAFHYVELDVLLPSAIAGEETLAAACAQAGPSLPQAAASAVRELAAWHRVCAEYLRKLLPAVQAG